jgi:ribosomal-protein-alanine N-acetyltransferase
MTRWGLPPRLESERLLLRPCLFDDLGPFLGFFTDERATRYLLVPEEQKTPHGATEFFRAVLASYQTDEPFFALAILDRESGSFVGICGLSPVTRPDEAECFYAILPEYWGTGLATEAAGALLHHAFSNLALVRVRAFILPRNLPAARVAQKLGMQPLEREKRDIHPEEGIVYSIAAEDFMAPEEETHG